MSNLDVKSSQINQEINFKLNKLKGQKNWENTLFPWLRTELTYTSNSLEGNTLSLVETSLIINENQSVAGKNLREIYEAQNHALAWDFVQNNLLTKKTQELKEDDFLAIHALILKNIDDQNAGKYRNVAVRIAGSNNIFPNFLKVNQLMENIFEELNKALTDTEEKTLETAILTHLKIVKIHPFTDGNGRTTRLFMNAILMQNNLPPIDILPENRQLYLESLENSDFEKPKQFLETMLAFYNQNLDVYLETFN
jgi:Fic family protein